MQCRIVFRQQLQPWTRSQSPRISGRFSVLQYLAVCGQTQTAPQENHGQTMLKNEQHIGSKKTYGPKIYWTV